MLDTTTKRRIDTARDILVGKVPDPKSQVEQITIALIYKFMDDMDAEAEELGGKRKFFTGDFARYGWAKLLRSGLSGHETLALYAEGITKMTENPGLPELFRDIFKNAYLHGFSDPHIYEYDTLTSEERWNEFADVILANPPFMSPKGGIKPHQRFSIQSKRSEVLFVDYMAEHLTPAGRAAIIVPEGIIFQSQNAYKDLRRKLIDECLVAVVSLPAGCFNPYSGVKTSILIFDKALARHSDSIGFFKVENDGFGLGAQRRPIDQDDLPQVKRELHDYLHALRAKQPTDELEPRHGLIVGKERIKENGECNLSGERYAAPLAATHDFDSVKLGDERYFRIESGGTPKSGEPAYWEGDIPWATLVDLPAEDFISEITDTKRKITERGLKESSAKLIPANSVIVSTRATIGRIGINRVPTATNQGFKNIIILDPANVITEYVALAITRLVPTMDAWATGGTFKEISKSKFSELEIPLPPLPVQQEIVAEIEGYEQRISELETEITGEKMKIESTLERVWGGEQ